jgi:hypothetical protein
MRRLAVWLGLVVVAAALGYAQAKDPFAGSWAMDPDQSTFTPGPVPMERYMTFAMSDKGMTHLTKTPSLFDGSSNITYTAKFDGKVSERAVMKVSADGKTLTITTKGKFRGTECSSGQIFVRQ